MQLDMHYYGTYAMARAAGIKPGAAQTIATCAQFVDDNAANTDIKFGNGAWVESIATAHHTIDKENLNGSDQRKVWVPFHFLPGNIGETWTERLKCRMDSQIAQELVEHHLSLSQSSFALELIGITAHVYADTFSHYGFSGVSSRGNKIVNDSIVLNELDPEIKAYVLGKYENFKKSKGHKLLPNFRPNVVPAGKWYEVLKNKVVSWVGETFSGALGHGAVATFPDRPYLNWEFKYERNDAYLADLTGNSGTDARRPNPSTFLLGCEALHGMFAKLREARPDLDNGDFRDFSSIRTAVVEILATQAKKEGRINRWQKAAADGTVFGNGEMIPEYKGELWNAEWQELDGEEDSLVILDKPIWHFYQAAALHRTYVLRDLLPSHKIIVS